MNTLKIIIMLAVGAYLFSCTKELQLDIDPLPAKIVVDGKIEINEIPQVVLRYSDYLYDTIDIESTKIKSDSVGVETKVEINDWIDIGVFADNEEDSLVFEKRVKVNKPRMTFTFILDEKPARAAIDPKMLLIDRVYGDNSKECNLKE